MSLLKIKNEPNFVKDSETGAIMNINKKEIESYHTRKATMVSARQAKEELNIMMNRLHEIDDIKKDINEIKELLKGLVK